MTSLENPSNRRPVSRRLAGWGVAALVAVCPALANAQSGEDLTTLADRLIKLRGEVETLHDDIETRQQQHRNRMTSLAQRRAELEAQIQRQELQLKKIRRDVGELRSQAKTIDEESALLRPVAKNAAETLEKHVDRSLPFTVEERKADIKEKIRKLEKGELTTPRTLNQLWSFVEDELRLCRENTMFSQTVVVNGEPVLADVVRLGMAMLFFRTNDGSITGRAVRTNDAWTFEPLDGTQAKQADELFDAFERQVRTGFFTIPNALPGETR